MFVFIANDNEGVEQSVGLVMVTDRENNQFMTGCNY